MLYMFLIKVNNFRIILHLKILKPSVMSSHIKTEPQFFKIYFCLNLLFPFKLKYLYIDKAIYSTSLLSGVYTSCTIDIYTHLHVHFIYVCVHNCFIILDITCFYSMFKYTFSVDYGFISV